MVHELPEIHLNKTLIEKARKPIERMLNLGTT